MIAELLVWVLPIAYNEDCADVNDQYVKWRSFSKGCAFSPENKILHFDHIFPKRKILGQFLTGLRKFRLKKALTMGMLTSKLPLS